ncbi:zinc ribbon domain-containing protein [Microcoleus sp. AR_TQ3_B6]|uniref:zinc ribbon domain-containing protein n=1 Tax=Microcoleus sp. AR_TQ3_B6 TaxID=3055284 RepID=UPI002FD273E7
MNPACTSPESSSCGTIVNQRLSARSHICKCGCEMDTDQNVAINILALRDRYGRAYRNLATTVA